MQEKTSFLQEESVKALSLLEQAIFDHYGSPSPTGHLSPVEVIVVTDSTKLRVSATLSLQSFADEKHDLANLQPNFANDLFASACNASPSKVYQFTGQRIRSVTVQEETFTCIAGEETLWRLTIDTAFSLNFETGRIAFGLMIVNDEDVEVTIPRDSGLVPLPECGYFFDDYAHKSIKVETRLLPLTEASERYSRRV
jgi:hypothetical protein